eukprot:Clim_evm53s128 gene=Clim_evmTU53s128
MDATLEGKLERPPFVWIVIGVCGSGKTTLGRMLAERLECDFLEADRRHSAGNVAKMAAGKPLNDADRQPWLDEMENDVRLYVERKREVVITCSALKRKYRDQLRRPGGNDDSKVVFVWLDFRNGLATLKERLMARKEHYMSADMLEVQLASFEDLDRSGEGPFVRLSAATSTRDVTEKSTQQCLDALWGCITTECPALGTLWWERMISL